MATSARARQNGDPRIGADRGNVRNRTWQNEDRTDFEGVDFAALVDLAYDGGCECDVCEGLRSLRAADNLRLAWRWPAALTLLALLCVLELMQVLGAGGLRGVFE